jgi:hypothetical protein
MLNLNNVPADDNPQEREFSLIPNGTICRAVMVVKQGDMEIPEFGQGAWFKKSMSTAAKWMELEFTFVPSGQAPVMQTPAAAQTMQAAPAQPQASGAVPSWAQR